MKKFVLYFTALLLVVSCASTSKGISQGAPTIQYLNASGDGSITVRVSAIGRNYADAIDHANKYALHQTIFYGISIPDNGFLSKPLVTEVNAEEKYQEFFNSFFSEEGAYAQFISTQDTRSGSNQKTTNKVSVRLVTTVRILRSDLKDFLLLNNIIKL